MPDVIFYLGKEGVVMFEERHQRLARPRDPEIAQYARKLDEMLSAITPYYQPAVTPLPRAPLKRLIEGALQDLQAVYRDVRSFSEQIQELKAKLQMSNSLQRIRGIRFPRTDAVDVYIVVSSRLQNEVISLARALGGGATAVGDITIITIDRGRAAELADALTKLGATPLTPDEVERLEAPDKLNEKLNNLNINIYRLIDRNREIINKAYTLRQAVAVVLETFGRSAIAEGLEMGHLFFSLRAEIERLRREYKELELVGDALKMIKAMGKKSLKIPPGFGLYLELQSNEPRAEVDLGGLKAYVARAGLEGVQVPPQYLEDVDSSLEVVSSSLASVRRTLEGRRRELEELQRVYKEYSIYGDEKWDEHKDITTIIFYVLEKNVEKVDNALVELIKSLSINIEIVKRLRYKYFSEVPRERRPVLERFPTPLRQFVNKIVYMYGVPSALEVSPSGLVAVLFPLFFGWMFGDLGHGLLLAILGLLLMGKLFGGRYREWGMIWLTTGVISMMFGGLVYAEFFGLPLSYFGVRWDGVFHLFQPTVGPSMGTAVETEGIFANLLAALLFGYVIMAGSFSLKIANFVKRGEGDMALGIGVPVLLLYIAAGMVVLGLLKTTLPLPALLSAAVDLPWMYVLIIAVILLISGSAALMLKYRGLEERPPIGSEMAVGLVEGIFGGLANIPSFSRLMILILMHGIFTKLTAGWAFALAASGNMAAAVAVAVTFNALIAVGEGFMSFIQSLRLTFYETLSKFYEGNGRLFTPLALP
ncbi:MAG: ATPase [Thermoproteus sp.]|nr:ATPase [Thermoproteus sp.]